MSTQNPPSTMPKLTFATGGILVVVGIIGYLATGFASWTALIPSIIGVLLLISGWIAQKNLMAGIHIALLLALIGALGMFMPLQDIGDLFAGEFDASVIAALVSLIVLVIYLVLGVRSFLAARRWKNS